LEQDRTRAHEIARRKWAWIGHTLRKPATDTTKQALKWNPQGKRKVGKPVKTWRRSTEEELKIANISWNTAGKTAANRVREFNTNRCKSPAVKQLKENKT